MQKLSFIITGNSKEKKYVSQLDKSYALSKRNVNLGTYPQVFGTMFGLR
jgi:hypothetical protein